MRAQKVRAIDVRRERSSGRQDVYRLSYRHAGEGRYEPMTVPAERRRHEQRRAAGATLIECRCVTVDTGRMLPMKPEKLEFRNEA